jgi:GTPase SAR1 family protein
MNDQPLDISIALFGDENVGKTSFIRRLKTGEFSDFDSRDTSSTTFLPFDTSNGKVEIFINDSPATKNDEKYNGGIIMFDINSSNIHEVVSLYYDLATVSCDHVIICGNKVDNILQRVNSNHLIMPIKLQVPYLDISIKTGYNIEKPILHLLRSIMEVPDLTFVDNSKKEETEEKNFEDMPGNFNETENKNKNKNEKEKDEIEEIMVEFSEAKLEEIIKEIEEIEEESDSSSSDSSDDESSSSDSDDKPPPLERDYVSGGIFHLIENDRKITADEDEELPALMPSHTYTFINTDCEIDPDQIIIVQANNFEECITKLLDNPDRSIKLLRWIHKRITRNPRFISNDKIIYDIKEIIKKHGIHYLFSTIPAKCNVDLQSNKYMKWVYHINDSNSILI